MLLVAIHTGENVGQLDFSGIAVLLGLDHCHQIQAQQCQIVQIVLSKAFAAQMRMNETESPESSGPAAKPSYVGKIQVRCISENHLSNDPVSGKQDADLPAKFSGK